MPLPPLSRDDRIPKMPELAEVEYYRKCWDVGLGQKVTQVELHKTKRVFHDGTAPRLAQNLVRRKLLASWCSGKQMLFSFSGGLWLGVHLGMTGNLRSEPPKAKAGPHDHLVLRQRRQSLVFTDPRQFGRIRLDESDAPPPWWSALAPPVLSPHFSVPVLTSFLARRGNSPIKAVLLMQERFPGIGNWMADEVLWRSGIFPERPSSSITTQEVRMLWRNLRWVSRSALATIAKDFSDPPESWLFPHRWRGGGLCPRDGHELFRKQIGGRTACWCPACQPG